MAAVAQVDRSPAGERNAMPGQRGGTIDPEPMIRMPIVGCCVGMRCERRPGARSSGGRHRPRHRAQARWAGQGHGHRPACAGVGQDRAKGRAPVEQRVRRGRAGERVPLPAGACATGWSQMHHRASRRGAIAGRWRCGSPSSSAFPGSTACACQGAARRTTGSCGQQPRRAGDGWPGAGPRGGRPRQQCRPERGSGARAPRRSRNAVRSR